MKKKLATTTAIVHALRDTHHSQTYRECIRCSHHGRGCFNALYSFWYLTLGVLEWCWPVRARIAWADGLEMELVTDCDRETRGYSCALWPHDGTTTPEDDVSTAREEDVIGNWLELALPITTHMIHVLTRCHFVYIQSYKHNNNANTNHIRGRCSALILLPLLGDFYSYLIDHFGSLLFININKLGALDTIYSFFGIHELILIAIGFFTLTKVRRTDQKLISRSGKFLYIILFLYLLPEFAALFESKRIFFFASQEEWPDGWNTMYVWFRYPMYWTIGILIYLRTQKTWTRYNNVYDPFESYSHFQEIVKFWWLLRNIHKALTISYFDVSWIGPKQKACEQIIYNIVAHTKWINGRK